MYDRRTYHRYTAALVHNAARGYVSNRETPKCKQSRTIEVSIWWSDGTAVSKTYDKLLQRVRTGSFVVERTPNVMPTVHARGNDEHGHMVVVPYWCDMYVA